MSNEENGVICTVCLESLKKNKFNNPPYIPPVISLTCSHSYHFDCIISWFTKSCSFLCPVCKHPDKILLENFLPEIKQTLHNEILKSSRDFLTDEEYEKYCEDCIKQSEMLKIIEHQQMLNARNQNALEDDYYDDYSDDDNYLSPIAREHYYQNAYSPSRSQPLDYHTYFNSDTLTATNLNFDNLTSEMETEIDDYFPEERRRDDNEDYSFLYRNGYLMNEGDEDEEDEDEVITYARGAINCILDDEEEARHILTSDKKKHQNKSRNRSKSKTRNKKRKEKDEDEEEEEEEEDDDDEDNIFSSSPRRSRHYRHSVGRPSLVLDDFLKLFSKSEPETSVDHIEYENILLDTSTKPSFFHKYRFYIISSVLFIIGYFVFL